MFSVGIEAGGFFEMNIPVSVALVSMTAKVMYALNLKGKVSFWNRLIGFILKNNVEQYNRTI